MPIVMPTHLPTLLPTLSPTFAPTVQPNVNGGVHGFVFLDSNGNGLYDPGNGDYPYGGAQVVITFDFFSVGTTTTMFDGHYVLSDISPGPAVVAVSTPPGYYLSTGNDPQTVTIVTGLNITAAEIGFTPLRCASGRVFGDMNGNGVQDNELLLVDTGLEDVTVNLVNGDGTHSTETGQFGNWMICNLTAGSATVLVIESTLPYIQFALTAGMNPVTVQLVNASLIYVLPFGFQPLGNAEGLIYYDTNGNGVRNLPLDLGIAAVTIQITDMYGAAHVAVTNTFGVWYIANMPEGVATYNLVSTLPYGTQTQGTNGQNFLVVQDETVTIQSGYWNPPTSAPTPSPTTVIQPTTEPVPTVITTATPTAMPTTESLLPTAREMLLVGIVALVVVGIGLASLYHQRDVLRAFVQRRWPKQKAVYSDDDYYQPDDTLQAQQMMDEELPTSTQNTMMHQHTGKIYRVRARHHIDHPDALIHYLSGDVGPSSHKMSQVPYSLQLGRKYLFIVKLPVHANPAQQQWVTIREVSHGYSQVAPEFPHATISGAILFIPHNLGRYDILLNNSTRVAQIYVTRDVQENAKNK